MPSTILDATTDEHFRFIAERFEETIALWEDYEVTSESVAKRQRDITEWGGNEKVHLTVATDSEGAPVGFNSLFISEDYNGLPYGKIVILFLLIGFGWFWL